MTIEQFRKSKDYNESVDKIKKYSTGFEFTLEFSKIPAPKRNALRILTDDCSKEGLIESVKIGLDIHGNLVEETFRRI